MGIDSVINKIDSHLARKVEHPLIVDAQNRHDLTALIAHYKVGEKTFVDVSKYCKNDEFPHIEVLLDELPRNENKLFVVGLTFFLMLQGEKVLKETLRSILNMATAGHIVIITYQCKQYLRFRDPRLSSRICIIDGKEDSIPALIFSSEGLALPKGIIIYKGLHNIASAVERAVSEYIFIETKKAKLDFPHSIYYLKTINNTFDILLACDTATKSLQESYGTDDTWKYALSLFDNGGWSTIIESNFGNRNTLELIIPNLDSFDDRKKWLYFIGLKLYGAKNNWSLDEAARKSESPKDCVRQIYRSILAVDHADATFPEKYASRKLLANQLHNPIDEVADYCKLVQSMGKNALYYLTDNTQMEKEAIIALLAKYGLEFGRDEIMAILQRVFPALYDYFSPYHFKHELFNTYFQDYKYQKLLNVVFPEFEQIVMEQAEKREYNLLLEPLESKLDTMNRNGVQLYFVDALGVEFLGYIMALCKELGLMANITVCRCNLPSITSMNIDFLKLFSDSGYPNINIKDIDVIKHNGIYNCDYQHTKLPIHLIGELDFLRDLFCKIKEQLVSGNPDRIIIAADHGASRLAVIHETENIWDMSEKGVHSGRCCPLSDVDEQPLSATNANGFWALANYDRFRGGRPACVEVHGGASLEEVVVPIIELSYVSGSIEVRVMSVDAITFDPAIIPEIEVSYRKKARIKLYVSAKLPAICVRVNDHYYDAVANDSGYFTVDMPDIIKAKTYYLDVLACGNIIAEKLPLIVKKEGVGERNIL